MNAGKIVDTLRDWLQTSLAPAAKDGFGSVTATTILYLSAPAALASDFDD